MSRNIRVLVVDDDPLLRKLVTEQLARSDFAASSAGNGRECLDTLRDADYDVVLLDIMMPDMSGLDALREIRKLDDPPEVVMLTADTSLATGIEAMRHGAYDYLTKPATLDEMEAVLHKADEKRRLIKQNASLRSVARGTGAGDEALPVVHANPLMAAVVTEAEAAARTDSTILVTGESGCGKDVLARYIHSCSARSSTPMITVNCGALPETLFESEFFGHERGAFTGASSLRRGLLEAADGSTLFLDEIGDMPLLMQVKLLHFLEQGRFRRVGSTRDQSADVRIIAATNRNLSADIERQRFRADLYYRLNVVSIQVPPLRDRPEDIPILIDSFIQLYRQRFNRPELDVSPDARQRLQDRGRAMFASCATSLSAPRQSRRMTSSKPTRFHSPARRNQQVAERRQRPPPLKRLPRRSMNSNANILRILKTSDGNRERAAAILGISSRTLDPKIREYETDTRSSGLATKTKSRQQLQALNQSPFGTPHRVSAR